MLDLIRERPRDQVADFPGFIDLQEMLALPDIQAHTHLWTGPDGKLVSFAILYREIASASLIYEIAPGCKGAGIQDQLMAWAEASIRSASPGYSGDFLLETSIRSDNLERIVMLEGCGFKPLEGGSLHLERVLENPIPEPLLPAGFLIRPIKGEAEAAAWVRLHRAALGTESMTIEYKLAMLRTPYYDPAIDLVAVTAEDVLAAYCVCFIDVEENGLTGRRVGYTDPIATHPDFQRRGLSKALILTGLSLLKERGMETARLGTDSENIAMIHTAESVGFKIKERVLRYSKSIHLG